MAEQQPSPYKPKSMRIPPQSIEAEKALLGSILLRPTGMYEVADIISSESFYVDKHATIWRMMLDLFQSQEPIDLVSLSEKLRSAQLLETVGGATYLAELTSTVPASTNVEHYAKVVADKALLRALIQTGDFLTELGFKESEPIHDIIESAEKRVFAVTQSPTGARFVGLRELMPGRMEEYERTQGTDGELRGVPSGFASVDKMLSGFQKTDLVILAARPSMGKTSLALDFARKSAVEHGSRVGIFSLEMSKESLIDRLVSAQSQVDGWKIRTGKTTADDMINVRNAMDELSRAPIFIEDTPGNTVLAMRSTARRLKREHGLDLVLIDYLQLINTARHYDNMVNQVAEISGMLKAMARELEIPVVALSQLSRAVESRGGKPRLSDLRDSGAIEQDADVVMFIHREDQYKDPSERTGLAEILVEKHRNGATGRIEMYFDAPKTSFMDIDNHHSEQAYPAVGAGGIDAFDQF